MDELDTHLIEIFLTEAHQTVEALENFRGGDTQEIWRLLHNLKSAAYATGQTPLAQLVHELESSLTQEKEFQAKMLMLKELVEDPRLRAGLRRKQPVNPVGLTLRKARNVVDELGKRLGKKVLFLFEDSSEGVDEEILKKLNAPIMHMIRNSLDHGIESSARRRAQNKSSHGHIQFKMFNEDHRLVIEIIDDGEGLDQSKIGDFSRIFERGFSTREALGEVSGMGLGLHIVKTEVENMGGRVDVESERYKGTTIRITV